MKTPTLDGPQFGEIFIPRERAANQLVSHLKQSKHLPLISIHGPSGVGKTDLAGPILTRKLKSISGKSTPKLLNLKISREDTALDVALRVTDLIIENHSEFRSRKTAQIFRDKMKRSVRRSPGDAADRLRSMMRTSEKGKFDFKKIQLVICLDSVDKLFESRARCGADLSKVAICGNLDDPAGFLSHLVGMKTILFTITHRSWASRDIRTVLDCGGIRDDRRFDLHLSYPNAEEVQEIVAKVLAPVKEQSAQPDEVEEYGDLLTETLRKNPALIGLLPGALAATFRDIDGNYTRSEGCAGRYLANNGLVGELADKADEIYLQQNTNNRLALEEVFSNLIKGDGRLLIKDVVMSEELWAIALTFVDNRILAIDGRSYRNARLITTHKGLLSAWERAVNWTGAKRSVGITQLRFLDDKALSWQLAERNRELLIRHGEALEDAAMILRDSELSSQLSPLTRDYLIKSLKPKRGLKDVLLSKYIWIPVGAVSAGLFLLIALIVVIPEEILNPELSQESTEPGEVEVTKVEMKVPETPELKPVKTKKFLEEIKVDPVTDELFASAERISDASIPESVELPLLAELELIPMPSPMEAAKEIPDVPPVITKSDLESYLDQMKRKKPGMEFAVPLVLPSTQNHFEESLPEAEETVVKESKPAEEIKSASAEPVEKALDPDPEPRPDSPVGKPVPLEGLETATGHIEKAVLPKMKGDDNARLFAGLSNHRLEVGGAETDIINITSNASWREILNSMGGGIAGENVDLVLDSLRSFHEKTILFPDEIKNIQVSEFRDLTSHLGKVALVQQDRVAMKGAWQLELVSQNVVELNTSLRMLMARLALNAGREKEAVAYLAQTKIQDEIKKESVDFVKAAISWHYNEAGKATETFRRLLPSQARAQ